MKFINLERKGNFKILFQRRSSIQLSRHDTHCKNIHDRSSLSKLQCFWLDLYTQFHWRYKLRFIDTWQ